MDREKLPTTRRRRRANEIMRPQQPRVGGNPYVFSVNPLPLRERVAKPGGYASTHARQVRPSQAAAPPLPAAAGMTIARGAPAVKRGPMRDRRSRPGDANRGPGSIVNERPRNRRQVALRPTRGPG